MTSSLGGDDEPSLCGVGSHVVGGFGNDRDLEATTMQAFDTIAMPAGSRRRVFFCSVLKPTRSTNVADSLGGHS